MSNTLSKVIGCASFLFTVTQSNIISAAPQEIDPKTAKQTDFSLGNFNQYPQLFNNQFALIELEGTSTINFINWSLPPLNFIGDRPNFLAQFVDQLNPDPQKFPPCQLTALLYNREEVCLYQEFSAKSTSCIAPATQLSAINADDLALKSQLAVTQTGEQIVAREMERFQQRVADLEVTINPPEANQISNSPRISFSENTSRFRSRMRSSYDTNFAQQDRLRFRLQSENTLRVLDPIGTEFLNLGFEEIDSEDSNELEFDSLEYRFNLTSHVKVNFQALGGGLDDFSQELNPALGETVSRFGRRNPILRQGGEQGIGLAYDLGKDISLNLGYTIDDIYDGDRPIASSPSGTIVNLAFTPVETVGLSFTYVRSFNSLDTNTGSDRANEPFDGETDSLVADSYGTELSLRLSPNITLGGWVGYTQAIAQDLPNKPQADILNYAIALTWENIGHKDNVAGIVFGQPPKAINNDFQIGNRNNVDPESYFHLEGFFRFQATEKLAITPGLLVFSDPENESSNNTIYVGTVQFNLDF